MVESIIVPYIAEIRVKKEPACPESIRDADRDVGDFVGRVLGTSGIGLLILAGIFLLIIKPILGVITRFDTEAINLIYRLLIETTPLVILLVWTSVLTGTLNAYKKFAWPALSPAFRAIINLSIIFAFKDIWGVHAIAWGYVIGELVRLCILAGIIYRSRLFPLRLSFRLNPKLREFLKTSSYQVLGMVAVGLNPIVDKAMTSWLGKGEVSILQYADRLYMIPVTFISTGLMITLLSYWSERFYQSGPGRLKGDIKKALKVIIPLTLAITAGLILISQPIVKLAFGRGEFPQEKIPEVCYVWIYYLIGLVPHFIGIIFVRAHLVLKNTRILLYLAITNCLLNFSLNYILMQRYAVQGIALATSITSSIIMIGLILTFIRKIRNV